MEDMSGAGLAAVITAISTFILGALALLGAAIRYVAALILDAYKAQATATTDAKDRESIAKDERIERLERDKENMNQVIREDKETIRALREDKETIRDLREVIRNISSDRGQHRS